MYCGDLSGTRRTRDGASNNGQTVSDSLPFHLEDSSGGSGSDSGIYLLMSSVIQDEDPQLVYQDEKYECKVCVMIKSKHRLLRDPVQTSCGHRMCRICVDIFLKTELSKRCPANEDDCEEVTKDTVFPDPGCRREMKQLLAYCYNASKGCEKKITLSCWEKHLATCEFREVQCSYLSRGCSLKILFRNFEKHVAECKHQPVTCELCGSECSLNFKREHDTEICPEATVSCPYSCGSLTLKRRELADHKTVCPRKPKECRFKSLGCTFTGSKKNVKKHEQDVNSHFLVLLECVTICKIQAQDQQKDIQKLKQLSKQLIGNQKTTENSVKTENKGLRIKMVQQVERLIIAEQKVEHLAEGAAKLIQEYEHLQQSVTQLKSLIQQVANHDTQLTNHTTQIAEMDLRFQMIETTSYDGTLLWKIFDFSKRKRDASEGRTLSLYSQPFYTSRYGYKMAGRVYLNGDGIGHGTHMSLYFVVMNGEYDALLSWPFQCKVILMLLDQSSEKRHLEDEFHPDPRSMSFRRPFNTEMNIASGCPLFVAHTVLDRPSNNYIKDDVLFIKIVIDTTNLQPL